MKTKRLHVYIAVEQMQKLDEISVTVAQANNRKGLTKSEHVRMALDKYFKEGEQNGK